MITITNKHLRWSMLVAFIITPWIGVLCGVPLFPPKTLGPNWVSLWILIEGVIAMIGILGFFMLLLMDDIKFKYTIKLWKSRAYTPPSEEIGEMLHKFGQEPIEDAVGRPNPEYHRLYTELKRRGVFGE